jgi:hypothetical protein
MIFDPLQPRVAQSWEQHAGYLWLRRARILGVEDSQIICEQAFVHAQVAALHAPLRLAEFKNGPCSLQLLVDRPSKIEHHRHFVLVEFASKLTLA